MNSTENKSERELADHIEKLIAALRGTKIPEAWFEFKQTQALRGEVPQKRIDSTVT